MARFQQILRRTGAVATRWMYALGARARSVPVTTVGWGLLVMGIGAWFIGARLGWIELLVIAAGCLLAVAIGAIWTLRRSSLLVTVTLVKDRVVVGERAVGRVVAQNTSKRRIGAARIEVPVGRGLAEFETRGLAAGASWEDTFVVPTQRRAVIPVGPPQAVNVDPLGVARREVSSGEPTELFVHPVTVRLPSISSGWLRDLEGQTTNDLSSSDVAFHTLREYVPGDDVRHVHWRSSARHGTLLVRQFVDTRRSHVGVVLSLAPRHWAGEEQFEFGVSVAGSVARTALMEGQSVSMIAGDRMLSSYSQQSLLDGLAGVDRASREPLLAAMIHRTVPVFRRVSFALLVVGSEVAATDLRRHCERFRSDIRVAAIRCESGAQPSRSQLGRLTVLNVGDLDGLARVLHRGGLG